MAWAQCPICKKTKRMTGTGRIARHRMQVRTEKGRAVMQPCLGAGMRPASR